MCKLNIKDIDNSSDYPNIIVLGKGQKYRKVYLNAKALYAIKKYLELRNDNESALFVSCRAPYKRLSIAGVENVFKKYSEITNIYVYPHKIRHTTATQGLKHGMSIPNLQAILGHESPNTTMIYAHLIDEDIKYQHGKYIN